MKSKKLIITLTILLLVIVGSDKTWAQTLVLWHSDGTTTDVELFTLPNVRFVKEKVLVTSSVANLEYDKKDILRFTYKGQGTAISVQSRETDFEQKDGKIVFHDVKSLDKVSLYKTNGIRVPIRLTRHNKDAVLSLTSIPSGVYLLCVNGRTSKFTKK